MPAPVSYTEAELAQFIVNAMGSAAGGLTVSSPLVTGAVTSVTRLLGTEIEDVTDMALLEAAATWKAWEAAYSQALSSWDQLKAGSASVSRTQYFGNLVTRLGLARSAYLIE